MRLRIVISEEVGAADHASHLEIMFFIKIEIKIDPNQFLLTVPYGT
jgi:hypothetical protein